MHAPCMHCCMHYVRMNEVRRCLAFCLRCRVGVIAKFFKSKSSGSAQPFAYRYTEIPAEAREEVFRFGGVSVFLLLLLIAAAVAIACKFIRRGSRVAQVFGQVFAGVSRRKAFNRQGK